METEWYVSLLQKLMFNILIKYFHGNVEFPEALSLNPLPVSYKLKILMKFTNLFILLKTNQKIQELHYRKMDFHSTANIS